jgi:hypothetical protein
MAPQDQVFLFLSPEVDRFLTENGVTTRELLGKANLKVGIQLGDNPASSSAGEKEPATILLASAALVAAATPILRELIRGLSGREAVVRERHLLPVEDSKGNVMHDVAGAPILHWVDIVKGAAPDQASQAIHIKGFGIEISFGGK